MDMRDLPAGYRALRVGRMSTAGGAMLITSTTRGRLPIFAAHAVADAACRCFVDPAILGENRLHAWVLMPDHAQWLVELGTRDRIESLVNRMKSSSARAANRLNGVSGPVWSHGFHDRSLRSPFAVTEATHYIAMNPIRAGLAKGINDYPFSHLTWFRSGSSVGAGPACD